MKKKIFIISGLLSVVLVFLTLQTGSLLVLFDRTPTVSMTFDVPVEKYEDVLDALGEFSEENNYRHRFSPSTSSEGSFTFSGGRSQEHIFAIIGADDRVVEFAIYSSKVPGIRRSESETIILAEGLSNRLLSLEGVTQSEFELPKP